MIIYTWVVFGLFCVAWFNSAYEAGKKNKPEIIIYWSIEIGIMMPLIGHVLNWW